MDVVFVHGTTQSPLGWQRTVRELRSLGHRCVSVDLTLTDRDARAAEFAADVADQVDVNEPMVVAHSGSGMLLGAICAALDAAHQVFLAAIIPDGARSLTAELRDRAAEMFSADWIGVDPVSDLDAARHCLFHDRDDETTRWALTTLRSFYPAAVYDEVVPLDTSRATSVIVPVGDRTIRADWMAQAARQRLGVAPIEIPGGHCLHVSAPGIVATTLHQLTNN